MPNPAPLRAACGLLIVACACAQPVLAQRASTGTTVIQPANVRTDVAQVMRVEPVYQTLRATRVEQHCPGKDPEKRGLSRIVGAVKDVLAGEEEPVRADPGCELVPVEREFRRTIAYDVDYVYRGMKYRSRLPYDPGNRLRVQVSVMPVVPAPRPR